MAGFDSLFGQVAAVLAICAVVSALAVLLRLPLVFGLIAAGVLVGPEVLGLVQISDEIELLARIGIALLLFVVGLKLDIRVVRVLGPIAFWIGLGQIVLTSLLSFGIALAFGFEPVAAGYIGLAMALSSTIIVVKILSDRRELKVLHGRIAVGILIVQDLVVVLAMIGLSGLQDPGGSVGMQVAGLVGRGVILLLGVRLLARHVIPWAMHLFARQAELLVLAAVSWAVLLASAAAYLGFSEEVGAFLAGVALASSPYRDAISGRLTALRDFLLVFFFLELGAAVGLSDVVAAPGLVIALSLVALVGKPLIIIALTGRLGYQARTSFQSGVTLGQISEFSLILVALGVSLGHVEPGTAGIVTAVALITIAVSTLMVKNSDALYARLRHIVERFERSRPAIDLTEAGDHRPHVVLLGLGRFGSALHDELTRRGVDVLGVDFDPRNRLAVSPDKVTIFGDVEDPELPHHLPLNDVQVVISSIRDVGANLVLLEALRAHGFEGRSVVSADDPDDRVRLEEAGADMVLCPLQDAAAGEMSRLLAPMLEPRDHAVSWSTGSP